MIELPDTAEVGRRGPLDQICRLLGLPPVKSDLELLKLVENGLPLGSAWVLSANLETAAVRAGEVVDLSVPRRILALPDRGIQRLTRDESDKLVRVARILALAEGVFTSPAKAVSWLRAPKPSLGGESPMTALATEIGGRLVETMLHQVDHGMTP